MTPEEFAMLPATERVKLEFRDVLKTLALTLSSECRTNLDGNRMLVTPPPITMTLDLYSLVEMALETRVAHYVREAYHQGRRDGQEHERRYWEDLEREP